MSESPNTAVASASDKTLTIEHLASKRWRMENLYWIQDDDGRVIKFVPNIVQRRLFNGVWHRNLILKSRKHGCTTFIDLYILDECLFNNNVEGAIIADSLVHAQSIFRRIIKFAYDGLPEPIKAARALLTQSKTELSFSNGSVISVGVTMRSSSPQLLHVSEFGLTCVRAPDKAREIVTGSLQSVEHGGDQIVWIESTASGRGGYFYDYCQRAQKRKGRKPTKLDFKFFFFPWYEHKSHVLKAPEDEIEPKCRQYLQRLERRLKLNLTIAQKSWYGKQWEMLGPDIKSEHPSTPEEAFEVAQEGQYFREQMIKLRQQGRITDVPIVPGVPVDTYWDIGVDDLTDIWFVQTINDQIRMVDFYENSDFGLDFYVDFLKSKGYNYRRHYGPHDVGAREWGAGAKTRVQLALEMGLRFKVVPRPENKADSIESARKVLQFCWFDEEKCAAGIEHLEMYRKAWDSRYGIWKTTPVHDVHSNAADAFQVLGLAHTFNANAVQLSAGSVDDWAV